MDRVEQVSTEGPEGPPEPGVAGAPRVADVTPLDVTGLRYVTVVTVGWGVAFVAMLPLTDRLEAAGRGWWPWTCLVGLGLGLLAFEYSRRRARGLHDAYVAQLPLPGGEVAGGDAAGGDAAGGAVPPEV